MADAGVEYVVMEVSAHALAMHRLSGMRFAVAAFTNFSQDHLDYFGDMDTYFDAKMRLFQPDMSEAIVYNCDDERVAAGIRALGREALRTGIRESSDIYANDIEAVSYTHLKWSFFLYAAVAVLAALDVYKRQR